MTFSSEDIANAKLYRYGGKDESLIIKYFYRFFWDRMVLYFPDWVAPNLITLAGFLLEVFSFAISFVYSEGLTKAVPPWVCYCNGICCCLYQCLDNLDGRQARRTGSSTPLGQFFDHGCDAITGVGEMFKVAASFNFGLCDETFYFIFLMGFGFYLTSWEEYVTKSFYLGPINGPDEGLTILYIAQILAGMFPDKVAIAKTPLIKAAFCLGLMITCGGILYNVIRKTAGNKKLRVKGFLAFVPCLISIIIFLAIYQTNQASAKNVYFILNAGYILQYGSQVIITSFITDRPPSRLFNIPYIILWAIASATLFIPSLANIPYFWKYYLVLILSIMVAFDIDVIISLCRGLGIHAFKIKPKAH